MKLYHISSNPLHEGMKLDKNFDCIDPLVEPFMMALKKGDEAFEMLLIEARYMRAVLRRFKMREWSNYAKWATEAVFEHVRKNGFQDRSSRIDSVFYYDNLENSKRLYQEDYVIPGDAEGVGIYEIDVEDDAPQTFDMSLYDEALSAMEENHNIEAARKLAQKYYSGVRKANAIMEILSNKGATVIQRVDI